MNDVCIVYTMYSLLSPPDAYASPLRFAAKAAPKQSKSKNMQMPRLRL